jgi:hypothetical protein
VVETHASSGNTSERPLPLSARVLDGVGLSLLLVGISVMVAGGGREWTPFGRLSLTSWHRPIVVGTALLLLRHWRLRHPSLLRRLLSTWTAGVRSTESRAVWPAFLSTRLGVLLVGFFGVALLGYAPNMPAFRVYDNDLLDLPARWDAGWYLGIADNGYRWDATQPAQMQNIAFFPAYPMLMRYGSIVVGHQHLLAGVVVSFVAFFFALRFVFRLARESIGDDGATTAVALLAAYPFAFYYSAAYTEAWFLLTITATCYYFERDRLLAAAGWGLAAGLSRPNGCLLSVVLAMIALRGYRSTAPRTLATRLAVAAMPGVGLLIFSAYIYSLTGNPLQWADNHAAYGRVFRSMGGLVDDRIQYIQSNGLYNYVTVLSLDVVNAVPVLFALGCVWPVYKRFGAPYAAMILLNILLPLHMGGVLSMGRLTAVMFPIFLWLGAVIAPQQRTSWLVLFSMLQALLAIAFFTWRPLY